MLATLALLAASATLATSAYVVFFALLGRRRAGPGPNPPVSASVPEPDSSTPTRFVVLIPAHNESAGLLPTLASVAASAYPAGLHRSLVIADNCDDDTAACAGQAGVEVWRRIDPDHRGKGQALEWAFARLMTPGSPAWDAIVVLDADSVLAPGFLSALDRAFAVAREQGEHALALQGRYEFSFGAAALPGAPGWFDALTIASKAAENSYIYRPRAALGLVTLLQGNGFALSREALARVRFAAGSVVEDAEYALALALGGVRVGYVDDALVLSRMTARLADASPQRLRWAGGVFALIRSAAPRLLAAALHTRDWRMAEALVMLLVTSRLVLLYLATLAFALTAGAWSLSGWAGARPAALVLAASLVLQTLYLALVLTAAPRARLSLGTLTRLPAYLLFLLWAQCRAVLGVRRGLWHRTVR